MNLELDMAYSLLRLSFVFNFFVFLCMHIFLLYHFYKKNHFKHAWLAFIPVFPFFILPIFSKINRSRWNSLLWLIPIANIYFIIRDFIELYKAIDLPVKRSMFVTFFIPFGFYLVLMYVISKREQTHQPFTIPDREPVIIQTRALPKEKVLAKHFFDDRSNALFASKWLKSNLEVFIQGGFTVHSTYFSGIKNDLIEAEISKNDILTFVKEKHFYYDDCLSLFIKGTRDSAMSPILENYLLIFNNLCHLAFDEKEINKRTLQIVEATIHLIKISDTKDADDLYELLFDDDTLFSLAHVLGTETHKLRDVLTNFYND